MFKFVAINHPSETRDRTRQERIRQHAIRNGIQNKRKQEAKRNENFVSVDVDAKTGKLRRNPRQVTALTIPRPVAGGLLDPFESLPGDGERLRALMAHKSARHAGEPVFCVEDAGKIFFDGMDTIFRGALSDPALFNALSLALALAASNNVPNVECLKLRGATLTNLRHRMGVPHWIPSVSTLTAMLLLIGYEYRVDGSNANSIVIHIQAVQNVLNMAKASKVAISDSIRRALFWQDLYSCLFVGTTRLLSHKDYEKFSHDNDLDFAPRSSVPSGFEKLISNFDEEFGSILSALNALCGVVDTRCTPGGSPIKEHPIDNSQYCIESRLIDLLSHVRSLAVEDNIYEACIFACFLSTYKLSTGIWEGCFIPEYCSTQILSLLSRTREDPRWKEDGYKELLVWLLFTSGSLAQRHRIQKRAFKLISETFFSVLQGIHDDWDALEDVLKGFIWSSHAMEQKTWQFWQEMHSPRQLSYSLDDESVRMHPA